MTSLIFGAEEEKNGMWFERKL